MKTFREIRFFKNPKKRMDRSGNINLFLSQKIDH
jgi:hypothetical protein